MVSHDDSYAPAAATASRRAVVGGSLAWRLLWLPADLVWPATFPLTEALTCLFPRPVACASAGQQRGQLTRRFARADQLSLRSSGDGFARAELLRWAGHYVGRVARADVAEPRHAHGWSIPDGRGWSWRISGNCLDRRELFEGVGRFLTDFVGQTPCIGRDPGCYGAVNYQKCAVARRHHAELGGFNGESIGRAQLRSLSSQIVVSLACDLHSLGGVVDLELLARNLGLKRGRPEQQRKEEDRHDSDQANSAPTTRNDVELRALRRRGACTPTVVLTIGRRSSVLRRGASRIGSGICSCSAADMIQLPLTVVSAVRSTTRRSADEARRLAAISAAVACLATLRTTRA